MEVSDYIGEILPASPPTNVGVQHPFPGLYPIPRLSTHQIYGSAFQFSRLHGNPAWGHTGCAHSSDMIYSDGESKYARYSVVEYPNHKFQFGVHEKKPLPTPEERESNFPMEDDSDGSEDEFPFHAEDFHHRHRSGPEEWSLLSESRYRTRWNVLLLLITLDLLSSCVLLVIALERRDEKQVILISAVYAVFNIVKDAIGWFALVRQNINLITTFIVMAGLSMCASALLSFSPLIFFHLAMFVLALQLRMTLRENRMDLPLRITQRMRPYFNPWLSASSEEEQEDDNNHVDVENSIVREEGGMEEVEIEVLEEVEVENVDGDRIELHEPVGAGDVSG